MGKIDFEKSLCEMERFLKMPPKGEFREHASVSFLELPSFSEHTYICLQWNEDAARWIHNVGYLHFSEFNENIDNNKFQNRVERKDMLVSRKCVVEILSILDSLKVHSVFSSRCVLGLDGTNFEIKFRNSKDTSGFKWWEKLPEEWKEFEKIITFLRERCPI